MNRFFKIFIPFGFVFRALIILISSWVIVHLMAVFGFFLFLVYPFYWLIQKTPFCLWCQLNKRDRDFCNYSHIFLNSFLILVFTAFSVGAVYLEGRILFKLGFPPTPKTVSFVIPSKGQYRLGEIFPMKIEVVGIKVPINALQADISFDPSKLEVVDISTKDSFANVFIQKEINNEVGYARLTGGLPNPGFFSDRGIFGTVFFKGKSPGIAKVSFLPSSLVLANDGRGTNVLKDFSTVSYLVLPEKISLEEEELQKELSFFSPVLGEKTEETQLKFYEENKVLGLQTDKEIKESTKSNLVKVFWGFWETIDRVILSFWGKIFGR